MRSQLLEIHCDNQQDTEALAVALAQKAVAGDVFALTGDLGAGKSTFARAFIRQAVGNKNAEVPSPTFTLVQAYSGQHYDVYHADLYRLRDPDEVYDLGLDDERASAVMLIEWPDRLPSDWWENIIQVSLKRAKQNKQTVAFDEARLVTIKAKGTRWSSLEETE